MTRIRMPFTLRRYDLDDFEDYQRLRKVATYIRSPEGAWPLRGPRARDTNPPAAGRRANGARPS